jgi:hypothetical protein
VKLRYFVGMSYEEAAAALGIAVPTAKQWWAYARAWLRVELGASNRFGGVWSQNRTLKLQYFSRPEFACKNNEQFRQAIAAGGRSSLVSSRHGEAVGETRRLSSIRVQTTRYLICKVIKRQKGARFIAGRHMR